MSDEEQTDDGELELEDFGGEDLAPPPPPPVPQQNKPAPPPKELVEIAKRIAASGDNLEQMAHVHSALCASISDVLGDPTISAAERRRELRTISAAAAKVFPYKRLYEAEQLIKADRAELDKRKRERIGAQLEKRKIAGGGKVIPIRGSAVDAKDPDGGIKP